MARAIFCILPEATSLQSLLESLLQHGIAEENISYLSYQSAPRQKIHSAGARVESMSPPEMGKVLATGHLKWALDGSMSAGRAPAVGRALRGMGMPDFEARHYEGLIRKGKVLVSIYCQQNMQFKLAKTLLQKMGAEEIASSGEPEHSAKPAQSSIPPRSQPL